MDATRQFGLQNNSATVNTHILTCNDVIKSGVTLLVRMLTLLQSSRKLGTSLSVGWKLARSDWSSGNSGPSASSRESKNNEKALVLCNTRF